MKFLSRIAAFAALLPLLALAAYPERPINMIVAYSPGGGTDLVARGIAPYIEKHLGNNARIIVMNRPGAGGEIGFAALANAAPDGYTIGFVNTPNVITIPIERKAQYNSGQFELLGNIVDDPGNFSVHSDSPIRNLQDLAAYAKSRPGEVTVGTTGVGSDDHLAMLLFEKMAGVKMNHIPMKGAADVRGGIVGKQIDVAAMNIGEAMQAAAGGAPMRQLGQMSLARTNLAPDVPTFAEQGMKIEMASLRGIAAPKGLPPEIRRQLAQAIERAARDPEFQAKAVQYYAPLRYLGPAEFEKVFKQTEEDFRKLWTEIPWGDK
ncbi:MAG TPA: tripartite tricarboxylate transporter substrate binding protein [Usitatibacter sp.]|nr:tripartite tricarboxylate transporter substrate binding protein [Usitatibacter sp.]